jgi:hypothetical protein
MDSQDELFIRGFNGGYLLAQHQPELLAKVMKNLNLSNDFLAGLSQGQLEYQQERIRLELEHLSQLREQGRDIDRDLSQG